MVVLAAAIEPNPDVRKIATMLTASIDTNNFLTEAHAKLRPVESPTAGIFLSGVCQGPKDIPETVAQAGAAAVKVIGLLAKDKLTTNPCTAQSDELLCNGCSTCANVCPYGAISYDCLLYTSLQELALINPDTRGWLTIPDTHIDYPVLQGNDDMEYINKDVFGEFSLSGSLFLSLSLIHICRFLL